jgi:hypothetical protein
MDTLFGLIPLIFLLGLLTGFIWLLKTRYKDKKWFIRLTNSTTTYSILISWTFIGFLFNLDYTLNWGCIIFSETIFTTENIMYSGIALSLLSIGHFIPSRKIGVLVLTAELLFWIYKLFLVKGGYAVGFGGIPAIDVLAFDTIALTLRLTLIKKISKTPFRTMLVLIPVLIIMFIKLQFFR